MTQFNFSDHISTDSFHVVLPFRYFMRLEYTTDPPKRADPAYVALGYPPALCTCLYNTLAWPRCYISRSLFEGCIGVGFQDMMESWLGAAGFPRSMLNVFLIVFALLNQASHKVMNNLYRLISYSVACLVTPVDGHHICTDCHPRLFCKKPLWYFK